MLPNRETFIKLKKVHKSDKSDPCLDKDFKEKLSNLKVIAKTKIFLISETLPLSAVNARQKLDTS